MTAPTANLAYGHQRKHYIKTQTTFDTLLAFAATDGCRCIKMDMDPSIKFEENKEAGATASLISETAGKRAGKWNLQAYVKPNAAGVAPDVGEVLKSAFGVETVTPATSVGYALSDASTTLYPLQMQECTTGVIQKIASGAWVEQLDLEAQGGNQPTISASGGFASYIHAYTSAIGAGGILDAATVIPVYAGTDTNFAVGAVVQIGTSTGTAGAGHTITTITPATPSITVTPGVTGNQAEGLAIVPLAVAPTVSGTILGGCAHSLTIGGAAVGFISAKVSLKTGVKGLDKESGSDRATRLSRGDRRVTGEISCYFLDTENGQLITNWTGTTKQIILRLGPNTAANRLTVTIPAARIEVEAPKVPEADEATATIKFVARMSSTACDEMNWLFS